MNLTLNALNHLSTTILSAVLNSVAPAMAAALILWLALRFMPRVNAATRHAVWWAALATVVIMPFTLLPRSAHDSLPAVAAQSPASAPVNFGATPSPDDRTLPASKSADAESQVVISGSASPSLAYQQFASLFHPIELRAGKWPGWFFTFWLAACLFLSGRLIHSYLHLRGLRLNARPATGELAARFERQLAGTSILRRPVLLVSDKIASPLAAGFFRPMVVLPERLLREIDEPELDYVLLHELAHVARRDDWTNLLARVATALFAFHPVALWILKRIEREREIACDDWVVAKTGSARRYAATLARLFEVCRARRHELLATGMARRSSHLGERIEMLLKPRADFAGRASLTRVLICIAAAVALLTAGTQMPGWVIFAQERSGIPAPPPMPEIAPVPPLPAAPDVAGIPAPLPEVSAAVPAVPGRPAMPPVPSVPSVMTVPHVPSVPAVPSVMKVPSVPSVPSVPTLPASSAGGQSSMAGASREWKLERSGMLSSKVRFTVERRKGDNQWTSTRDVDAAKHGISVSLLDHDGPVHFEYSAGAGKIVCDGQVSGGKGSGTFTVKVDPEFSAALQKMGYDAPSDDSAFYLIAGDITLEFARSVRETGLPATTEDLVRLSDYRVPVDYIRETRKAGYGNFTASDYTQLWSYHVSLDLLKGLKAQGYEFPSKDIAQLASYHVTPEYIRGIRQAGYKDFSVADLTQLSSYHVDPELLKGLKAQGYDFPVRDIVQLASFHVEPGYIREIRQAGYKDLSVADLTQLSSYHVSPELLKGLKAQGYDLPIKDVVQLGSYGVSGEYMESLKSAGLEKLPVKDIVQLKSYGVPARYIADTRSMGYKFSIGEIVRLHSFGVSESELRRLHDSGKKDLTVDEILKLRMQ